MPTSKGHLDLWCKLIPIYFKNLLYSLDVKIDLHAEIYGDTLSFYMTPVMSFSLEFKVRS